MKYKNSIGQILFDTANVIFMLGMVFVTLYPLLYVVFASLSDAALLMQNDGFIFWPLGLDFSAYVAVFENPLIKSGYMNTIFVVVVGVALNIMMTAIGAYFLSRRDVYFKNLIMVMIVITMFFGGGLIPFYLTVKGIGLYNSLFALIIPSAISTFNLIIMRTAFQTIPASLEESAQMDGARHITILFKIVLPLSLPTIAVMVLFYGVGHWNSWFNAMIFIINKAKFPLQLILRDILIQNQTGEMSANVSDLDKYSVSETIKYATIIVATLPILILYPFLQKYFVKGIMVGSIKG